LTGALVLTAAHAVAPRFIFPRHRIVRSRIVASDAERRVVLARDRVPVEYLAFAGPPGAPVIVHFHTNRQTLADVLWLGRALRARGLGAVLVEYRGYGTVTDASPSEAGLYRDAEGVLDDLASRGVSRSRVVLFGNSLGTGVAAEMARRRRGGSLVLLAPFTSVPDVVRAAVPLAPARLLIDDTFDTLAKAAEIDVPTLVVHGDADEVIPFAMGEQLAATFPRARLVRVPGGHHGDLFVRARARVLDAIETLARAAERRASAD
jgi:hypothetical protein